METTIDDLTPFVENLIHDARIEATHLKNLSFEYEKEGNSKLASELREAYLLIKCLAGVLEVQCRVS